MANISTDFSTWSAIPASNQPDGIDTADLPGDLRALQAALKIIFPNIGAALTPTHTEFNYVDGVTSAIQSQLNAKAVKGANSDITSLSALTSINGGQLAGFRNIIINGGFTLNQRGYVSGSALTAGSYAHDRWKAGAIGGDYSFTQLNSNTQITIASGKSLIQVVENKNVQDTTYVLSWAGTAQARVGVNSATPSGSYASSPILITGQTAGTTMSIEFGAGTLGDVQLEIGSIATKFEYRPYQTELALCQRYYWKSTLALGIAALAAGGFGIKYPVTMRVAPTLSNATFSVGVGSPGTAGALSAGIDGLVIYNTANNWNIGTFVGCSFELTGAEI